MAHAAGERVRQEAELWFARRREPSVRHSESEAFERWRGQSSEHAKAYAETQRLWDRLAVLHRSERLRAQMPDRPAAGVFVPRRRYVLAAGLAAALAFAAIWFSPSSEMEAFATGVGEQRTQTLTDGTTLRLNTSSAIDVRMSVGRREILLRAGEAAFDVAKDATRPFVVHAGDGAITALGTHFQVRSSSSEIAVTLIEGRVQLARPSHREIGWLEPGQQATFSSNATGIVIRNVDVGALTSWMRGRMEFSDTPLAQAVAEANRYSTRKIRLGDTAVGSISVSGTFRTGDIDALVTAFEAAFSVRAEVKEKETVLYAR